MNLLKKLFTPSVSSAHSITPDDARSIAKSCIRSPDLSILEQYEFQLLFSPDRTQRGCSEYPLIQDSAFVCYAYTLRRFNYYLQRDGLPIPLESDPNRPAVGNKFPPPLKVKGELHAIRPYQFRELDNFKDNLVSFRRQRVRLLIPHRPVYKLPQRYANGKPIPLITDQFAIGEERIGRPIEAWMYVGVADYWKDVLDGGYLFEPVSYYEDKRRWLQQYYSLKRETYF